MNDFLEEQPIEYILQNLIRLRVFNNDERPFLIRTYIKYYIMNHSKFDNLKSAIKQMYPDQVEDINKFLALK